jgi:hypothetical protein
MFGWVYWKSQVENFYEAACKAARQWTVDFMVQKFLDVMVSSCKTQSIFLVPVLDFTKFTHTFLFILHKNK